MRLPKAIRDSLFPFGKRGRKSLDTMADGGHFEVGQGTHPSVNNSPQDPKWKLFPGTWTKIMLKILAPSRHME